MTSGEFTSANGSLGCHCEPSPALARGKRAKVVADGARDLLSPWSPLVTRTSSISLIFYLPDSNALTSALIFIRFT